MSRIVFSQFEKISSIAKISYQRHRNGVIIEEKEKAKVVAAVWGTNFIQFHAALQIYYQDDMNKRMNKIKGTATNVISDTP